VRSTVPSLTPPKGCAPVRSIADVARFVERAAKAKSPIAARDPRYENVVEEVFAYLVQRRDALIASGIDRDRICLDPGIGFGKTHQHNLTLMANCGRFLALGCPVLIGHSRKGFLGKLLGDKEADRDAATAGAALAAAAQGIQIIRVHNVRLVRQALLAFEACGGLGGEEMQLA